MEGGRASGAAVTAVLRFRLQEVAPVGGTEASGRVFVRRGAGPGLRVWTPLGRGREGQGMVTQLSARRELAQAGVEMCSVISPPPPLPFAF